MFFSGSRNIGSIEVSEHTYSRAVETILLGDSAHRNVRFENAIIFHFNAVAKHPTVPASQWFKEKAAPIA